MPHEQRRVDSSARYLHETLLSLNMAFVILAFVFLYNWRHLALWKAFRGIPITIPGITIAVPTIVIN